jgi:2-polyprenyl-3-methyl-5-hydroxy-6-metoxy-1,4-benzoquinol methylase
LQLLVEGITHPILAFRRVMKSLRHGRALRSVWFIIDSRFKLTKKMKVGNDGERLVVKDWHSAVNSHDFVVLAHIQRYLWVQQYLDNLVCLDAGCGAGYGTYFLALNGVNKIIGVDISADAIKYDQKEFRAANLEFKQMSVTKLEFSSDFFDAVISFDVLEHLNEVDQRKFIAEAARLLKPNGAAYIGCPNAKRTVQWSNRFHLRELLREEFELLLKQSFQDVAVLGQDIIYKGVRQEENRDTKVPNLSLANFVIAEDGYTHGLLSICKKPRKML